MKRLLVFLLVAACTPKPPPSLNPVLPGDGDANTAKPPPSTKPAIADPWAGRLDMLVPPASKPPVPIELAKIEELKLSNGLQVYILKNDRLPVTSLQLAVRAGRDDEPRSRLGVADFTADLLVRGTKRHDAKAITKAIEVVGGSIGAEATFEATVLSCSVLARNFNTCLELVPEMVTEPTFPDAEIDKRQQLLVGQIRQRLDDPGTLASLHAQNLLWGNDHVRGWIPSEQSIKAIQRDDLVAWHKSWFVPGNAMIVVSGAVDARKLKADLERSFGGWKKGTVPPTPSFKDPALAGIRIRLVDKPGLTSTHIRVAQFGIKHDDPRFFDTLVWNYALGGSALGSRLMTAVRGDGGKYSASSSFDRNLDRGSFVAQTFVRNSDALAVTKVLLAEIAKMAKDGPTAEEVTAAIANLAGTYGLRFQSASDVGGQLLTAELHGFGEQYLRNYPIAVGRVDVTSAKQAAQEILDPKDFVIVMVGDAKDVEPQLKKEGWRYEKVAFTEPITPVFAEPPAPVDPKTAATAKKIIEEAIAAKGGRTKLQAITSLKMTATGTTTIQGKTIPVVIDREFVTPDKLRIDATLTLPDGKVNVLVGVDGKGGWQRAPDQKTHTIAVVDIPTTQMGSIDFERWREPELILLHGLEKDAKLSLGADVDIDGKPQSVVKLVSPFADVAVSLAIDKKTKLITRASFDDGGASNSDDYSDYRDIGGIKVAHKRLSAGGGRSTDLLLSNVKINTTIDPKDFQRPAQ